jgi:acyl-CoA synthetase (AMP-forming)/AMP-acid ligase II
VGISDGAAIHNALALDEAILAPLEIRRHIDAIVSWLPLHHDMGLVGAFLLAILTGRDLVLLPPQAFLARPRQWLNEIGTCSSALSLSPAFGFDYCAERLAAGQASDLNLAGWRAAICGAETIHPRTAAEFTSAFASSSFRAEAFRAGYGLAEATVAVTLDRTGKGARTRPIPAENQRGGEIQEVVCLGEPVADTEIRCAGPNGIERREDQIGEILVRGPGLFSGYFDDAPAARAAFHQGWLRTGDLGFIHSGELYLTGRLKDVLIIRGENFMPQQLEWMAEGICGGMSRAAAFSVESARSSERAVLLVETREQDRERIAETSLEIRSRIGDAFGLQLADLVFVRRGRLPTTPSGKLRRSEAQAQYLAGRLQSVES